MSALKPYISEQRAPFFAGAIALVSFLIIGFRGFGEAGIGWLTGAQEFTAQGMAPRPGIGSDLLGALAIQLSPFAAGWTLVGLALFCGAISTALVFTLATRTAGALGGWVALCILLLSAPWVALFTRADPTALLLPFLLGYVLVWQGPLSWWKKSLFGAPLLAISVLLWPGAALLAAALILIALSQRPRLYLEHLFVLLGAGCLLLLLPPFWPAPLDGLGAFFLNALADPAPQLLFRDTVYGPARPPVYFGAAWFLEQLPIAIAFALIAGLLRAFFFAPEKARPLVLNLAALALLLLAFPVFFRGPRPLGAAFEPLVLALAVPLASLAACRFFTFVLSQNAPSLKLRQFGIAAYFVIATSVLLETPTAMTLPEAYRSPLTARLTTWSALSDMPLRENILPLSIVNYAIDDEHRLDVTGWEAHLAAYESMGLISATDLADLTKDATAAIRLVPPVAARRFASYAAPYAAPLPGSATHVLPAAHRPVFLIDLR